MGKYSVKFEIEVIVDDDNINVGNDFDVVFDTNNWRPGENIISDEDYNSIVDTALNQMEDIADSLTTIRKLPDDYNE